MQDRAATQDSEAEGDTSAKARAGQAGFALFLLVTAVLFVRPSEMVPDLAVVPIYELLIIGCFFASLPALFEVLRWQSLVRQPANLCVLALLPAFVLSYLSHGDLWGARTWGLEFSKVILYYLLLIALLNTPERFRSFLSAVVLFIVLVASLTLLDYHRLIHLAAFSPLERVTGVDDATGEQRIELQLRASGIFNDPNDFSLILVTAVLVVVHLGIQVKGWASWLKWSVPVSVLAYAFALTRSRGGFLALLAGALTYMVCRVGWRRSIPLGVIVLPAILVLFAGRQTRINLDEGDTAQQRLNLWRDGIVLLKATPVFGIGHNQFVEETGHVAHNSYVQCYVELGLIGGTLFTGALFIPLASLRRLGLSGVRNVEGDLHRWWPCMMSITIAYGVGLCSLTRTEVVPTYLLIGVAVAYCTLMSATVPAAAPVLSARLVWRVGAVGVAWLGCLYIFVRLFAR